MSHLLRTRLKGVVRLAVTEAGGQENCANVSSRIRRAAAFSDYANPALDDRHIPLDVAVELDGFNGNGRIIGAAAAELGFLLVPVPQAPAGRAAMGREIARALKETSEVFVAMADALSDGRISSDDSRRVATEIDEALARLAGLKLQVAAEVEGGE